MGDHESRIDHRGGDVTKDRLTEAFSTYLQKESEALATFPVREAAEAAFALLEAARRHATVYVLGNGGSAATAAHFVNDFNKELSVHAAEAFRTVCLSDNVPILTAIANDIGYEEVFRCQLEGRLTAEDVVLALSTSGNSENVLRAARYAREVGATVIALSGKEGGALRELADIAPVFPGETIQIVEDMHLMFDHMLLVALREFV